MIHRLHFSIDIKAGKANIWKALWDDQSYRDWAGVFYEGSYAISDRWEEGSTVLFLIPDQSGIYSLIESHIPNEIIRFKHIGTVVNGKEQPIDDETRKWSGSTEEYSLKESNDYVTLSVHIDVMDEHLEFMKSTFPKALERIKNNCH